MGTRNDKIELCNNHPIKPQIIELVQSLVFNTERELVKKIYSSFQEVYNKKLSPDDCTYRKLIEIELSKIKKPFSENSPLNNFEISDTDTHIGIDFPTWFNFTNKKPKLMIVGIDPLRSEAYWEDKISIGTPYNLHGLQWEEEKLQKNIFWNFISELAKSYSVYITDTFKVFFQEESSMKKRSYNCKRFTNPAAANWEEEIHQKIFKKETKIIEPVAIVTLGRKPVQWFTSMKTESFKKLKEKIENRNPNLFRDKIPVLSFSHLSGLATTFGKKLYGVSTASELPEKYISIINTYVERIKN